MFNVPVDSVVGKTVNLFNVISRQENQFSLIMCTTFQRNQNRKANALPPS